LSINSVLIEINVVGVPPPLHRITVYHQIVGNGVLDVFLSALLTSPYTVGNHPTGVETTGAFMPYITKLLDIFQTIWYNIIIKHQHY